MAGEGDERKPDMSVRLKYRIVKVSSEDPEFPASEVLCHSSQTKGWQSARFCEFPQELGLAFDCPVHLRQIQFLSHQSKIATKIELFTALPNRGGGGHQAPASTENYTSVKFTRLGYLSLDSNERSQFQARELKSVYVDVTAQYLKILLHKCHINKYNLVNQVGLIALNVLGEMLGPDLAMGPPPNAIRNPPREPQSQAADEVGFDSQTCERMRALETAKKRAVSNEDYDEAKRCKEMMTRLKSVGHALAQLEEKKRLAVSNEDYDTAKALKSEVDRLRTAVEGASLEAKQQLDGHRPREREPDRAPAQPRRQPEQELRDDRVTPPFDRRDEPPPVRTPQGGYSPPAEFPPGQPYSPQGPSPPQEDWGREGHPLRAVPNHEGLATPEVLTPSALKEQQPLIQLFGEYLVRCLLSKTWSLREAALIQIDHELDQGHFSDLGQHARDYLAAFSLILKRTVPDKITQVFLTSTQLLLSLCTQLFAPHLRKPEVQPALDQLMPLLTERLGDVNARCSSAARDTLLALAQCSAVGPLFTAQYLLRPIKKKNVPSRVLVTRLLLLRQLLVDFGVQPARRDGIPLEPTMSLAMEWFTNPAAEVRNACVSLVGAAYKEAGSRKVEPFLRDLRPAQRDAFEAEFEKNDSGRGMHDVDPLDDASDRGGGADADPQSTCQFCGFDGAGLALDASSLDLHYWKDCPMLVQCGICHQIVELMSMAEHRLTECAQD